MNLAEYVQHQLFRQKMTLYRLGKMTGISYGYLDRIEKNIKKNPSYEILKKMSVAFGVDVQELLEAVGYETDPGPTDRHGPTPTDIPLVPLSEYLNPPSGRRGAASNSPANTLTLSNIPKGMIGLVLDQPVPDHCIGDTIIIDPNRKADHESVIMIRDQETVLIGRIIKARLGLIWTPFGSHTVKSVRKHWVAERLIGGVVGLLRRY